MTFDDDDVSQALINFLMHQGSSPKVKITDVMAHQHGSMEIQFVVRSSEERFGLHVPLPSSPGHKPWVSDETQTAKKWVKAFYQWLVEQVEARYFPEAVRVPYLTISGSAFKVPTRQPFADD